MADYVKMYSELFNALTDAIEILKTAQLKTEEMYISSQPPAIEIAPPADLLAELTELELEGAVTALAGQKYAAANLA